MRPKRLIPVLLATAAVSLAAAVPPPKPPVANSAGPVQLHQGVPGIVFIGQPLSELLARFPTAVTSPFAGQADVVRVQVADRGLSCLVMGATPASMTVESIGFNFSGSYEGVDQGAWRTAEGIGRGSTINDLLGTYGKPEETIPERPAGIVPPRRPEAGESTALRHLYRSADGLVTTYFVVQGSDVVRMAIGRPAAVSKYILKTPAGSAPGAPAEAPPNGF